MELVITTTRDRTLPNRLAGHLPPLVSEHQVQIEQELSGQIIMVLWIAEGILDGRTQGQGA